MDITDKNLIAMQSNSNGYLKITGDDKFKIPATDFVISPLQADADLHIISIMDREQEEDVVVDSIVAGDYTKVTGAVPNTTFYVDTAEEYYVRW